MNLFCFPYAGGSAMVYYGWREFLHRQINLIPVELSGRGKRIHEPLYFDLQNAVDDLYNIISSQLDSAPYAFFGHSLGSLLAYELAQKIKASNIRQPTHLFFSGKASPNIKNVKEKNFHLMDAEKFKKEVIHLGGTPPEFFDHPELVDLFVPLLRNDFKLAETIVCKNEVAPFRCDISVFLGKNDEISAEQADGWKFHMSQNCSVYYFNGGHFFLHHEIQPIVSIISKRLI